MAGYGAFMVSIGCKIEYVRNPTYGFIRVVKQINQTINAMDNIDAEYEALCASMLATV